MLRTRRVITALTISAASALILTACTGTGSSPDPSASAEPATIEYWHINTEAFGAAAVDELVSEFNDAHPNITVEAKFYDGYSNLVTALQAAIAAGNAPDVAQIGYSRNRYVAENFPYVPISDLGVDTSTVEDNILELGQVDGTQVAMPYGLSVLQMYYNGDLLEQAGIDPADLKTWDDWTDAAETFKAATGLPLVNFQQFPGDNFIPQAMISSNGGSVLGCDDGTAKATFDSEEGIEAVGLMGELAQDGLATNLTSDQALQAFLGGQAGTLVTSSASRANLESQANFTLGANTFPSFGSQALKLPAGGNNLFVFSDTDAKKAAAAEFVEYLGTDPSAIETWVAGTGYLSPVEGAAAEYTESNPLQAIAAESAQYLTPWVSFPGQGGLQASQIMYDATQAIMGGTATAKDALTAAAEQINTQISGKSCG